MPSTLRAGVTELIVLSSGSSAQCPTRVTYTDGFSSFGDMKRVTDYTIPHRRLKMGYALRQNTKHSGVLEMSSSP